MRSYSTLMKSKIPEKYTFKSDLLLFRMDTSIGRKKAVEKYDKVKFNPSKINFHHLEVD